MDSGDGHSFPGPYACTVCGMSFEVWLRTRANGRARCPGAPAPAAATPEAVSLERLWDAVVSYARGANVADPGKPGAEEEEGADAGGEAADG